MTTTTVFGIANCDTVKKTRKWLDNHSVAYDFHDYKKKGIDQNTLKLWCETVGWETLLNRRGTTWRKLDDADKEGINEARAIDLMTKHTSMIKRPVIVKGDVLLVGFSNDEFQSLLPDA